MDENANKGKSRKRKGPETWVVVVTVLAVICIIAGGGGMIYQHIANSRQQAEYEQLAREVTETEPETESEEETMSETLPGWDEEDEDEEEETEGPAEAVDLESLMAINSDVVGWIKIPGTVVDYPIVKAADNDYYLHRNVYKEESTAGTIYMDYMDASDFSSLHNVIYGHHMRNGSMFKTIVYYTDQSYFNSHSDIYIYTPDREIHLKALAAVITTPDAIRRKTQFDSEADFQDYVSQMTANASAKADPDREINRLWSLVTCSYEFDDARTILYAYEAD